MTGDELFQKAMDAYELSHSVEEGVQAVINVVLESVMPTTIPAKPMLRRPNGTGSHPVHSFRVSDEIWKAAKVRALDDDRSISQVMVLLVMGYAEGLIDLAELEAVITP